MTRIVLAGDLDPTRARSLRDQLDREARNPRPSIEVDLSRVSSLHPAAVNALILGDRLARRSAGSLRVVPPAAAAATRTLGRIGLVDPLVG